jgi:phosphatidylethanolamine-binding protein (PEBP) family uncharacterized protein
VKKTTVSAGIPSILLVLVGGCSVDAAGDEFAQAEQASSCHSFKVKSKSFKDGAALPPRYTCEDAPFATGYSPHLKWNKGPKGTQSYAIVLADTTLVDAGQPNFGYHYAIWNIPSDHRFLPEGIPGLNPDAPGDVVPLPEGLEGAQHTQARGIPRFFGPCPSWQVTWAENCEIDPIERVTDSYSFTVYAIPEAHIEVPPYVTDPEDPDYNPNYVDAVNTYFESIALGSAVLTTTSDAVPTTTPPVPCPQAEQ